MHKLEHRHAAGGVGNDVIPTSEHKQIDIQCDSRRLDELIPYPNWALSPVVTPTVSTLKPPLLQNHLTWPSHLWLGLFGEIGSRSVSGWCVCILWPGAEGLHYWLDDLFLSGLRPETNWHICHALLVEEVGVVLLIRLDWVWPHRFYQKINPLLNLRYLSSSVIDSILFSLSYSSPE